VHVKIDGHKHVHVRDREGYTGCHSDECMCARCLLECGAEIPRERRSEVEAYKERVSEMSVCPNCGGIRISLLDAQQHTTFTVPATLWCQTCGNQQIAAVQPSKQAETRVEDLSLSQRLAMRRGKVDFDPRPEPEVQVRRTMASKMQTTKVTKSVEQPKLSLAERMKKGR
jgi:hypothetical protein